MLMLSNLNRPVITGGIFTQVNNNFNAQSRSSQTPWDRLQAAVAPAAFHNAAERFDPPRCHPNTRTGVMDELRDLALRRGDVRLVWLNGGAGAGKSAIAQSFCEECFSANSLLASFFFNRSDPSRNNAKSFVATLAYQVYRAVPAYNQSLILAAIEDDPLVFERSINAQFTALVMNPLQNLVEGGYFIDNAPSVIVVDGLDECATGPVQVSILTVLRNISMLPQSPFVFVITSRPEHDIQMFFKSPTSGLRGSLRQLILDDSYHPDADIELFLREKFQEMCAINPHRDTFPPGWPSNAVIKTLVWKSSGHFIYPSVAIQYITCSRRYLPHQLDVVLGLRPPRGGHPLAELDALYSHILSSVEDVNLVLQILRIVLLFADGYVDLLAEDVEQLCDLDQSECLNALCDLQSVVQIHSPNQTIRLLHKSLADYLKEPSRSNVYFIDTTPEVIIPIVLRALRIISDPNLDYNPRCLSFFLDYQRLLISNIQTTHEGLMSFSLMDCQKTLDRTDMKFTEPGLRSLLLWFSFGFIDDLCTLEGTEYEYVYRHHLRQYPELVRHYPQVYGPHSDENQDCIFPMLMIFVLLGNSEVHIPSEVFDILQPRGPLSHLSEIELPVDGFEDLSCAVARRCISSLMHDRYSNSAAFALECLPLVLPYSKLSADLNEACRLLHNSLDYSSTGRSLAYDFMGRPITQMHHTVSEMTRMTKAFEDSAFNAMQEYMGRYADYAESEISGME